jgi:hypothetical protein
MKTTILDVVDFPVEGMPRDFTDQEIFAADPRPDLVAYWQKQKVSVVQDPFLIETLERGFEAEIEARAAYWPAREFYGKGKPFRDVWHLRRFLKRHPEIRTRPAARHRRRLEIHLGDWCRYWRTVNPLDLAGHLLERFMVEDREIQRRKELEDARRRWLG